jgi:CPA2 family monovalent cation:H+ antiporter-2
MLATPFGLALGPHLASGLGKFNPLTRLLQVRTTAEMRDTEPLRNHVIIAGYGVTGQNLARALKQIGTRYIIVDLNTDNVRDADRQGEPACFGDVTSVEVLECLGAADARELVIAINDLDATVRATGAARRAAPGLRITVRTTYDTDVKRMVEAGATHVVASEAAAADAIIGQVLRNIGDSPDDRAGNPGAE